VLAVGNGCWANAVRKASTATAAACTGLVVTLLGACATDGQPWLDHAALVIRPSQHQAILAYSFGADALPPQTRRNVAAVVAAAVVSDELLPQLESMDFRGGRLSIHAARDRRFGSELFPPTDRSAGPCLDCGLIRPLPQ
jgi:hypothetical protein